MRLSSAAILLGILRVKSWKILKTGPVVINSAEHEIVSAHKYENAKNSWHFHIFSRENFMIS